jgi:hypothetical protein
MEQGVNQLAQLLVVAAQLVEVSSPLVGRHLQSRIDNAFFRVR